MDYSKYSYKELIEAYCSIDKEKYPETYSKLMQAIADAENELCESEKVDIAQVRESTITSRLMPKNKTECIGLLSIIFILGGILYSGYFRSRGGNLVFLSESPIQFAVLFVVIALTLLFAYVRHK